jgi:glutamine cyclotransferase
VKLFEPNLPRFFRNNSAATSLFLLWFISGLCFSQETGHAHEGDFTLEYIGSSQHSTDHFTQGLFFHEGRLFESVGRYGQSALIKYQQDNQTPGIQRKLDDHYFAEGATAHNGTIYQLTWQAETAFTYQGPMLSPSMGFKYSGEGWGLTSDGEFLWLSNGSDKLKRLDVNGQVLEELSVRLQERPVDRLNELEWINGWILANRWYDTRIYVINPITGEVEHAFDLTSLASRELRKNRNNVLNGIAWDPDTGKLWITGKNWSQFYQFKIGLPEETSP